MPNITICKNPFRPHLDRVEVVARAGTRLDTVLRREHLIAGRGRSLVRNHAFVVQVNSDWLTQDRWSRRLKADDVVLVALLPAGGGGGSNPLQIVAMVALAAVTAGAAAAWGPALGAAMGLSGTVAAGVGGALIGSAIMIGGSMLLSAIFPPAKPPSTMAREQASPTYTIGAQGNTARLMESIPVQYGRFRVYPDFAAQPYTELDSNQTYLYQLFCLGQGEYDIEEIRVEDTPISNFAEVQYEVVRPGEKVTLFPDNVVSSTAVQSIELKGPNEEGAAMVGPFVANPAGTTTNRIAVDIVLPAGLFYANDDAGLDSRSVSWSIQAQLIDDQGSSVGSPIVLGSETYSAATNTPQMMTYRYEVPEGRYQVSAVRTSNKDTNSRSGNTLQWGGLRAYLPDHRDYGNLTLLAVVMRATNNLNQSTARRINVIATRKLPTWDPVGGWSLGVAATRNPAWALADVCRNPEYGRGLPDSRINLTALYRLAQIWGGRGDTYDGVFDTATTLWDALTRIARVGRAMPMYYAGVIDFIRNEPKTVKTQMFTPGNMVTNTFSIDYVFPEHDSPDHVIVEFINEETWQPDEVVCALPGSAMLRPYRLQIPGIVQRDQAWREGISLAAQNRDQRRFVSFQTELEGHIPRYGDLVEISHDVPKWGLSGFIEDYNPDTKTLTTSEPLEWWPGENHYINLRKKDGSPDGPFRVVAGSHDREMVIADLIDGYMVFVSDGQGEEFTHYQFGPGERRSLLAQAVSATPDEQDHVALDFVNYAESVHVAENGGAVPPPNPSSLLPMIPNAPVVDEVTVYATPVAGEQIAACTPARGAQVYEFQASDDLGASWTSLESDTEASIRIRLPVGPWWVRARGVGVMPGPWKVWQGHIAATMQPPPSLSALFAEPLNWGIRISWAWPSGISLRYIEIWYSPTPNFLDATLLGLFGHPQSSHDMMGLALNSQFYFWARVRDEADQPGPWYPESGPGVRGTPNQVAGDYNGLITEDIIASGLGEQIMGNIREIPSIKETLSDLGLEVDGIRQDVDQHAVEIAEIPQIKDVLTDLGIDVTGLEDEINALQAEVADIVGAPNWDAQARYLAGQIVKFDGSLYRAIKNVPVGTPVGNAFYWEKIGDYDSIGQAVAALLVRMSNAEVSLDDLTGELIAQSQEILALQSDLSGLDGQVSGQAQLLEGLRTSVSELDGVVTSEAARTSSIIASLREDDGQGQLDAVLNEWDSRAWIQRTEKAVVDNQKAQATVNEQLGVQIGDNIAQIGSLFDVVATLDQSTAIKLDQLESSLGGLDGQVAGQAGALDLLKTDVSRINGEVTAQATSLSQLESGVADNKSAIQTVSQTVTDDKAAQATVNQKLQSDLSSLGGTVSGQAQALEGLETSVSEIDGVVASEAARTSSIITSLREDDGQGQLDAALNEWDSRAWIQRTEKAVVDNQKAQATINEQTGVQIGDNTAQIGSLSDVVATLDQSTAIKFDQLESTLGGLDGELAGQAGALDLLKTDVSRIDGAVTAQATSISQLESGVADNKSAIQTVGQTVADNKSAQAQVNQQVQSSIGDVAASAQESTEAIATLDGKIASSWAVKLQGNQNGVKYVAGVGLDLTNESGVTQSTFAVLADRFAVMHAVNGVPATVFSVQGGASIINSALIGNASITEAKITNAAIGRAKIQDAAINAAKIENAAITGAKIQDAAITRAKIGHAEVDTLRIAGHAVSIQSLVSVPYKREGSAVENRYFEMVVSYPYPAECCLLGGASGVFDASPSENVQSGGTGLELIVNGQSLGFFANGSALAKVSLPAGSHVFQVRQRYEGWSGLGFRYFSTATLVVIATMR
ncbi:host specificity factor TipJ family phage tail protein [Alcaligenes faecalis subsp. phenolicus]|uniref:host specificity factor TipJ family phage tail protein n=1 Tax=Alcaligenes nematophilus TaxID=2994643 RepID=UPI002AA34DCE|nr:host specificity factor TipJ family phage tail protein [Alcaligenes phenolicus]